MPFSLQQLVAGCGESKQAGENGSQSPPAREAGRSVSSCDGDPYGDGSEVRIRLESETSRQFQGSRKYSRHSAQDYKTESGYGCVGTLVVTLLILSPPVVLIGVVLLTTGAVLSSAHVFGSGLAVIVLGVLLGATSAFAFVRLRSVPSASSSIRTSSMSRNFSSGQHRPLTPRAASIIDTTDRTVEITYSSTGPETTRDL